MYETYRVIFIVSQVDSEKTFPGHPAEASPPAGSAEPARLASYYISWRLSRGISVRPGAGSMLALRLVKSCRNGEERKSERE